MTKKRPINLDLRTIRFPLPAIVSILHRISGVALFLFIPILLCMLQCSLKSPADFNHVHAQLSQIWVKLLMTAFLAGLLYHLFAGIRHMIMDMGYAETLSAGNKTARLVILLSILALVIVAGIVVW